MLISDVISDVIATLKYEILVAHFCLHNGYVTDMQTASTYFQGPILEFLGMHKYYEYV